MIGGITVVPSEFAVRHWVEFKVARWPIRKRRRNYFVKRIEHRDPGAYQVGNKLFMHPALVAKLQDLTKEPS